MSDETFERATRRAADLGLSRSELFAIAVNHYLDELDSRSLTADIDAVADVMNGDESSRTAVAAGRAVLLRDAEGW